MFNLKRKRRKKSSQVLNFQTLDRKVVLNQTAPGSSLQMSVDHPGSRRKLWLHCCSGQALVAGSSDIGKVYCLLLVGSDYIGQSPQPQLARLDSLEGTGNCSSCATLYFKSGREKVSDLLSNSVWEISCRVPSENLKRPLAHINKKLSWNLKFVDILFQSSVQNIK